MRARADLLIRGARLAGAPDKRPEPTDIVVAGGQIAALAPGGEGSIDAADVIEASGLLCVPGWVNGHLHSHELLFRGRSERMCLEEWMVSVRPFPPLPLTTADVRDRTLAVAVEAIRSGTTTLCDDVGLDPVAEPTLLDAAAGAYAEVGIRAFVGPTLFDVPFARAVALLDDPPPAPPLRPAADQLSALRAFAERLLARGASSARSSRRPPRSAARTGSCAAPRSWLAASACRFSPTSSRRARRPRGRTSKGATCVASLPSASSGP
jgi:cytosine/adenosine deaminase-related metal-dependent hydrolase